MQRKKTTAAFAHKALITGVCLLVALVTVLLAAVPNTVLAQEPEPPALPDSVPMSNKQCLECHAIPNMTLPLDEGELHLTIAPILFGSSVHGREGYSCVQCHTEITGFPHPEVTETSAREFAWEAVQICQNCHGEQWEQYSLGMHARAIEEDGNYQSAMCVDCHGSHNLTEFGASHTKIAQTCQKCHSDIYEVYRDSVHGNALLTNFNADVPTCIDCHDFHQNRALTDPTFHLYSPQVCAKCHADEKLMDKYGINTDVFDTYLSDFHGTTVEIFEQIAPDQPTNKPVCIDCHGVHDIRSPEDAGSSVIRARIDDTCRRCHEEATPNFSDAWLSHYPPDLEHNTLVFLVNLFYMVLIPGTVFGMLAFIGTDIYRKLRSKREMQ